jgi:hypothetical protein
MAKSSSVNAPKGAQVEVVEVAAPVVVTPVVVEAAPVVEANHKVLYRRDHPGGGVLGRCSYGIPGVSGIIVFDMALFVDGIAPPTITMDCSFVQPKADNKQAKLEAQAAKAADKAAKLEARMAAESLKAAVNAAKLAEVAAAAKAKVEAAQAQAAVAKSDAPAGL